MSPFADGAPPPAWMGYLGAALLCGALAAAGYALAVARDSALHRAFRAHAAALDAQCRLLFLATSGARIARAQALALVALLAAVVATEALAPCAALACVVAVAPSAVLARRVKERREAVERQLDAFLTTLANALRAAPSLGEALATAASLVRAPLREDLEFALKEHRLGAPLDRALIELGRRIDSRTVSAALATVLIGRQTGGDLSAILERSAATLREMARLEGVVRAKTAEGRSQAYVLAAVPVVVLFGIDSVDRGWFAPMTSSVVGYLVIAAAVALWVLGIVAARRILDVDV